MDGYLLFSCYSAQSSLNVFSTDWLFRWVVVTDGAFRWLNNQGGLLNL